MSSGGASAMSYWPLPRPSVVPAMTTAALTLVSRQQLSAIRPSVVMAPLEWPAAPISFGSTRPDNGPFGVLSALSTWSMTKLMSPGWFPMSPASAPPAVSLLDRGNNGAATTYPAAAQAFSSLLYS